MRLQGKYVQPVVMAGIMAFLMTAFITWFNLGFRPDFVWLWLKAFIVAWPLASGAAFIAAPGQGETDLDDLQSRALWEETLVLLMPAQESSVRHVRDLQTRGLAAFAPGCAR